jgi:adenine-specific DNA-methyltransferase
MDWKPSRDSANFTSGYVFNQLIPYLGNKRKLLGLIKEAIVHTGADFRDCDFVDLFAGTGVVSRFAKTLGFRVVANDWEPYSEAINRCCIATAQAPSFARGESYENTLAQLNALPPFQGWVTDHLCPDDDEAVDVERDRLFYTRENGMRIDAIREQIAAWEADGLLNNEQKAALLSPLLYQCSYNSNTSGVFKGFHNGWGGKTGTALYRIRGSVSLRPAAFLDNGRNNLVFRQDAGTLGPHLEEVVGARPIIYLDPPYNQHPYGSNYHVLNSVTLWDKPALSPKISGHGDKSAIRLDWRSNRRSAYNHRERAASAYRSLLASLPGGWYLTSYSTDGTIPLSDLVASNREVGDVTVLSRPYKRYRVSSQRFSEKPMNVEFILVTDAGRAATRSTDEIVSEIYAREAAVVEAHPETKERARDESQMELIYGE